MNKLNIKTNRSIFSFGKSLLTAAFALILTLITSVSINAQIALPYNETFAGITVANGFPTVAGGAWTRSGTTTNQPTYIANQASYNRSGNGDTKYMTFQYSSGTRYYFVGPFALTAGNTYQSSVLYKADGSTGFGPLALTWGTTAAAATHTNTIVTIPANITNAAFQTLSGSFVAPTTGNYFIAIKSTQNGNPWYLTVDDFSFSQLAVCSGTPAPGNTVSTVANACSGTNFTLSLQTPTSGSGVTYQWESADDAAFTVNLASLGTASTQVTSQTSAKYYRCNVTCSSGPSTGTSTPVLVGMNSFINCYCTVAGSTGTGDVITNVTMGTLNNTTTGTSFTTYNNTPEVLTQGTTVPISITFGTDGTQHSAVWIDFDQSGTFDASENLALSTTAAGGSSTVTYNMVLPSTGLLGTTRMRVRGASDGAYTAAGACTVTSYGETEDYLVDIVANSACAGTPTPGNTLTTADSTCAGVAFTLSLQNPTAGSGVTYVWESADDAAFTTNVATLASTTATQVVSSQTSAKYYRCIVTCATGPDSDTSAEVFVGQRIYQNCYCVPSVSSGCNFGDVIAQVQILDGATVLYSNNSGTGCPGGLTGYSDSTSLGSVVNLTAGNTYGCKVSAGEYGQNYAAWIDYNDDGIFDQATERIGYTTTTVAGSGSVGVLGSSATFNITLSCNPVPGIHRLRVRCIYGSAGNAITACGSASYGETEDYLITIDPPLPCPAPSGLAASSITSTTASFSWTNGCVETDWIIEYGQPGFTPGSGTPTNVTSNPATISGLPCNDTLEVYLQADCLGNGTSALVGPITVITGACPCAGTPAPGNTISTVSSACSGVDFNLTVQNVPFLTGYTYQWESADDSLFTTNFVALGNTVIDTFSQTSAKYYRCKVTCVNGPDSAYSSTYYMGMKAGYECYCNIGLHTSSSPCINEISVNTLTNNTAAAACALPAYSQTPLATATTTLVQGNTYSFTRVASGTGAWTGLWIDYDQNGTFDASEYTLISSASSGALTNTVNITIPLTATTGLTGMRIRQRTVDMTDADACTTGFGSGETEDYVITIDPAVPCTTPAPGNTISSVASVCTGSSVTLTLQNATTGTGVSYAWESADDAAFTVNLATLPSTTNTEVVFPTTAKYYRCNVKCASGPDSTYSTGVLVTMNIPINCYCTPAPTSMDANGITNVAIGTLTNPNVSLTRYQDFTSTVAAPDLALGVTHPIAVTYQTGYTYGTRAFIDFNQDGDFADTDEDQLIGISTSANPTTLTGSVIIPATATTGITRMRIVGTDDDLADDACYSSFYANVEDYYINIITCTTTATSTTNTTICSNLVPYSWNGQSLTTSGTYLDTLQGVTGCDSIATLNLTVINPTSSYDTVSAVGSYVWSANGTTYSTLGTNDYTHTLTNAAGCDSNLYLHLTLTPNSATLNLTALLEAYYGTSAGSFATPMPALLFDAGISTDPAACDSLIVELHTPASTLFARDVAYTTSGVLDTAGHLSVTFPGAAVGNYYWIVIRHRNSLEMWSNDSIQITSTTTRDFTDPAQIYGGYGAELASLPGVKMMFSGDINQDYSIDGLDYPLWENDFTDPAGLFGYLLSDINGDQAPDGLDFPYWENNFGISAFVAAPY